MFRKIKLLVALIICSSQVFAQELKLVVPSAHPQRITDVITDKQGKFIYTFDESRCIMWNISTGQQLHVFAMPKYTSYDISPDGNKLIIASRAGVKLFNTENGKEIKFFPSSRYNYSALFNASGDKIIGTNEEGEIELIDIKDFSRDVFLKDEDNMYDSDICLLPNNRFCLVTKDKILVYDLSSRQRISKTELTRSNYILLRASFQILKDGNFYDLATGQIVKKLTGDLAKNSFAETLLIPSNSNSDMVLVGINKQFGKNIPEISTYETTNFTKTKDFKKLTERDYFLGGYFDNRNKSLYLTTLTKLIVYNLNNDTYRYLAEPEFANFGTKLWASSAVNKSQGRLDVVTNYSKAKAVDLNRMVPEAFRDLGAEPFGYCTSITGDTTAVFQYGDSLTIRSTKTKKTIFKTRQIISSEKGSLVAAFKGGCFFFSMDGKVLYYLIYEYSSSTNNLMGLNLIDGVQKTIAKFKRINQQFYVSEDRNTIAGFEVEAANKAFVFDLKTRMKIFEADMDEKSMWTPSIEDQYISVSGDKTKVVIAKGTNLNIYDLKTKNLLVDKSKIEPLFEHSPRAASGDFSYFIFTDVNQSDLHVYNNAGNELYKITPHEREILAVYFSSDNKLFFTVSSDNTIKSFETATGRLFGTLYIFKETSDFVFIAPDGRYDGTPDGMKKLYYLKNREIYPLEILFEKYFSPNLFARLINGEIFPVITDNIIRSKPTVRIQYAEKTRNLEVEDDKPEYQNATGIAEITINATAPEDAVDEIRLFHNGKIVTLVTRNLIVEDDKSAAATRKYTVQLLPGQNTIRAVALNTQRTESDPDEITVQYKKDNTPDSKQVVVNNTDNTVISPVDKNATLYLIVIGINAYQNPAMSLNYALADATSFKIEIEKDSKTVISNTKTYFVTDANASKNGILEAFKQVQQNAKPQDVFIFYYAGHGVIGKDKEFYLVPNDVSDLKNVQSELESKGIPAKLLQQYAIDIQAQKQLFILDACQSAGAFNEMLATSGEQQKSIAVVSRSTGTHWMAASGAQQFANEFSQLGHGAFTYVLLQALNGSAASNKMITVNGLKNYLQQGVPELMKKYSGTLQYPASYGFGSDFPVEVMK